MDETLVAVYGTLKRGHGNHIRILSNAFYVGRGVSLDKFILFGEDTSFPYIFNPFGEHPSGHLSVEIFKVDQETLERCDSLEGHPNWYRREKRFFIADADEQVVPFRGIYMEAWLYIQPVSNWSHYFSESIIHPDDNDIVSWK